MSLADETCIPCRGGVTPMTLGEVHARLIELDPAWMINPQGHLERVLRFADFAEALAFVNRLGAESESQEHHPMIHFTWGMCTVEWWSHEIGGLHEADFIMAARTDRLV